jgi:hypothetical protein
MQNPLYRGSKLVLSTAPPTKNTPTLNLLSDQRCMRNLSADIMSHNAHCFFIYGVAADFGCVWLAAMGYDEAVDVEDVVAGEGY